MLAYEWTIHASVTHWAMIERCRRTLTALWAPLFSPSSSHSPREPFSLPFIWFSWAGAPCLVYPVPSSFSSEQPSFPTPPLHPQDVASLTPFLSCPSRTSQRSAPCLSALLSLHNPSLSAVRQTPRTCMHLCINTHTYSKGAHTN